MNWKIMSNYFSIDSQTCALHSMSKTQKTSTPSAKHFHFMENSRPVVNPS